MARSSRVKADSLSRSELLGNGLMTSEPRDYLGRDYVGVVVGFSREAVLLSSGDSLSFLSLRNYQVCKPGEGMRGIAA